MLTTDAYKFSMAQAGFPLRRETFYLSFRKGGWQYVPFDLEAEVRKMLDIDVVWDNDSYLDGNGYGLSAAMRTALIGEKVRGTSEHAEVDIKAVPSGTWVWEREPILTISGPSFLVSWLEPLMLMLAFPIQFATQVMKAELDDSMLTATCDDQADIMWRVIESCKLAYQGLGPPPRAIAELSIDSIKRDEEYQDRVRETVKALVDVVGSPDRIFEVGMRSATCLHHHRIALQAAQEGGLTMTSNVKLAKELGMKPIGTMGHEHIQRWGCDLDAYRAMRDMRVGKPSYLLDTFDTAGSGIPNAIKVLREAPHDASIRYDSGDKYGQYMFAHGAMRKAGLQPTHILEDGLNLEMTRKFEQLREFTELPPERQLYGYGGFIIAKTMRNPLTRDRVAANYKLAQTAGDPRMKWGDEAGIGKQSVPGSPVIWRRLRGEGIVSIIAQAEEPVPDDFIALNGNSEAAERLRLCNAAFLQAQTMGKPRSYDQTQPYTLSPETQKLIQQLQRG